MSENRSGSRALLLLLLRRSLVTSRRARAAGCGNEPSRSFFLLFRKNAVLTDASQLVGSGRYRIVGYCNRPERNVRTWTQPTSYPLGFPEPALYKVLHDLATEGTETNLGFCHLSACAATVVYSIPSAGVHRRTGEQVSGTTRLCDPVRERANKVFGKRFARLLASSSRVVYLQSRAVLRTVVSVAVFSDRSSPPLHQRLLRLQTISTCDVF